MKFFRSTACAVLLAGVALPGVANAALTISIQQLGGNVVMTSLGSLNISGLATLVTPFSFTAGITPTTAALATATGTGVLYYTITGPTSFGPGTTPIAASSSSGSMIALNSNVPAVGGGILGLSSTYVSGTALSSTTTFLGQTFASIGLTAGTYKYTLPNDTLTVVIGVPEPASWAMMVLGFGAIGTAVRRRKVRVAFA